MFDRPWLKSYSPGVSADPTVEVSTVDAILSQAAEEWGDKAALGFMGRRFSYRELDALVDRTAKGFQLLGVKPGVHVGLYLPNCPQFAIAFFGALRAGATIVNYSPLDAAAVLVNKIEDSETDVLVTLDLQALYPQLANVLDTTRVKRMVIGDLAEFSGAPEQARARLVAGQQLAEVTADPRHISFAALIDNDGAFAAAAIDPLTAIALLQYTGGTTGRPKGAMISHANIVAAIAMYSEAFKIEPRAFNRGDGRALVVLPLFHIFALLPYLIGSLKNGSEILLHVRFDPDAVLKDIETKGVTNFPGVPTMFSALVRHPAITPDSLKSLKYCVSGGAPLPGEVRNAFERMSDARFTEAWGMTETTATGTSTFYSPRAPKGSCGVPMPGIEMRFLSVEDGMTYVALGERGEICVRGPSIMRGYWKNEAATREIFTPDGFMRTGDVGWMDADGFLYIVDRTKDMILCSGFNVYPRNIEEAIHQHPAVEAVSVIGIPDDYRGQSPKAFIKLRADAPAMSLEEMKEFLKNRLGKHEMIAEMDIRPELPRTLVGKLSKKELYEEEARKRGA
jgi:long-chain acyl-CoA synthetase